MHSRTCQKLRYGMNPMGKTGADAGGQIGTVMSSLVGVMWILKGALVFSVMLNLFFVVCPNYFQPLNIAQRSYVCPVIVVNNSASPSPSPINTEQNELRLVLEQTAIMPNKTVILTYLNEAWITPNSMFDLFLESFRIGNNTQRLLRHLLIVSLDENAHRRCLAVHPHCYHLQIDTLNATGEASYKTPNYFKIVWRKIDFLRTVLDLGFNFLFTDGDIMWLRDPFQHLILEDSHFQVACDGYMGDPFSLKNIANTGFMYVASNPKTILFHKLWYSARLNYNKMHDQEIFNIMKESPLLKIIGLRVKFLDTVYFNGLCQSTRDYNKVCTIHATCRLGLVSKVKELKGVLDYWRNYTSSLPVLA